MKVSIVIPNYNGEELLRKNLPKVIEAVERYVKDSGEFVEIIIIDDASTDESVSSIKYYVSRIRDKGIKFKILENEKNLGFSSTVNRGVKEARGEIVVLLNTDVSPEKDFLEPLIKHFEDTKVFAVGCMDKSIENGEVVLRGRGIGRWERGFLVHARGEVDKQSLPFSGEKRKTNTLWVNGGSGAFRKSIWDKLGGFNELYNPFYYEDIDLSYRAQKSGYIVLFEPRSIVVHEHEKGAIKQAYSPFQIKAIAYRNQFIFVWKNATDMDLQFLHILWLPYHLLKALLRFDKAFFAGFFQASLTLPKIIQSSFKEQKLYVKSDRDVVREFVQ